MSLKDWFVQFKAQHEKARDGTLSGDGLAAYRAGRDEMARALLGALLDEQSPAEAAKS